MTEEKQRSPHSRKKASEQSKVQTELEPETSTRKETCGIFVVIKLFFVNSGLYKSQIKFSLGQFLIKSYRVNSSLVMWTTTPFSFFVYPFVLNLFQYV